MAGVWQWRWGEGRAPHTVHVELAGFAHAQALVVSVNGDSPVHETWWGRDLEVTGETEGRPGARFRTNTCYIRAAWETCKQRCGGGI